jgi:hypothetical protein
MERTMKKSVKELEEQIALENRVGDLTRARSVTVGTAFGGVTEISLRGNSGSLWCIMQPVEVIELIHQLAASVGCHINLQPRRDFATWRDWKYTDEELAHYRGEQHGAWGVGFAPHTKGWHEKQSLATSLPSPEQQPGLQPNLMSRNESNEQAVATKKTVGRKRVKRATKTS